MKMQSEFDLAPDLSTAIGKALAQLLDANQFSARRIALLFNVDEDDVMKALMLTASTQEPEDHNAPARVADDTYNF
jgi:hypothetical protein